MSLVINTNTIANIAARNLSNNQANLNKSLARLSSGSKLTQSSDDAGGLAVSTKLMAAINRNVRAQQNVQNSLSYLQVQDGALKEAAKILDRMSELKTMALDPTKNSTTIENYNTEFKTLQSQLGNINSEKFNDIALFDATKDLTTRTTEDATGAVSMSRSGLFDKLSESVLTQQAITSSAYVGTTAAATTTLTFTTPTHGLTATVSLTDGAGAGEVNGSDISAAIKGINDGLASAGITTIKASESADGQLVITGSETFTITENINGSGYNGGAGLGLGADVTGTAAQSYDGVAKTYDYNGLADYNYGDVIAGTRDDGSKESFLISHTSGVQGTGITFDEFAALARTTRLDNNMDPSAQVFQAGTTTYDSGEVVYNDSDGRYYLSRGVDGDYGVGDASSGNAITGTTATNEYLDLGTSLPGLNDTSAYDGSKEYFKDDIVSYDGSLYVANKTITEGEGSPVDNSADWLRLNVSVTGTDNLLDNSNDIHDFSVADLKSFIQMAATARADNGAQQSRLNSSYSMLQTNHTNLQAANSKLYDVDVATESTAFARANILVQSAASMLAQANASQNIALSLLQ